MNFKKLFLSIGLILLVKEAFAFENSFKLSENEYVKIFSEKVYNWPNKKKFEAVGNVVITLRPNAIYGDKASISFETFEAEVKGNVRYVGPEMTLYGSELFYNLKSKNFRIKNARLQTGNFTLSAKKIYKAGENKIIAEGAEFTTCKDCPSSWAVYGKKVEVIPGEYIYLTNAFFNIEGVSFLYLPYLVFPIKKKRETGLLLPKLEISDLIGAILTQPVFWAINDHIDLTVAPGIYGRRGFYNEAQYRQVLGDKKWFEFNSNQVVDNVYLPGKTNFDKSGEHFFRWYGNYEHHFNFGNNFNHHLNLAGLKDLDMLHDFLPYLGPYVEGAELGADGYINFRNKYFDLNLIAAYNRNMLVRDALAFDKSYVQILPKLTLSVPPITLLNFGFFPLQNISLGLYSDYTIFKQKEYDELNYIRNANRANIKAYADWNLGDLGPIDLRTNVTWDSQYYNFPHEKEEFLTKYTFLFKSQLKVELQKIYGIAYTEDIPPEKIDFKKLKEQNLKKTTKKDLGLIEAVPSVKQETQLEKFRIVKNSYKHSLQFIFNHYYTEKTKFIGNKRFQEQINTDLGTFDNIDAVRENEYQINNATARIELPIKNTLEFQLVNFLIRKRPIYKDPYTDERNLWDNFLFNRVLSFQIAQGYRFDIQSNNIEDKLTRLQVLLGINIGKLSFKLSEYYFYKEEGNIALMDIKQNFHRGNVGLLFNFNSFVEPTNKNLRVYAGIQPIDLLKIDFSYDYDFGNMKTNEYFIGGVFSPPNDCWKINLGYRANQIDWKILFSIDINYNQEAFKSNER